MTSLPALPVLKPQTLLHVARARHLAPLTLIAPDVVWGLFRLDQGAQEVTKAALHWLAMMNRRDTNMPNVFDYDDLYNFLRRRTGQWKSIVKRAAKRSATWQQVLAKTNLWRQDIFRQLDAMGAIVHTTEDLRPTHLCLLCSRSFGSKRAWFLHAHQKHGYTSMHGEAALGTSCPVCAKHPKALAPAKNSCKPILFYDYRQVQHVFFVEHLNFLLDLPPPKRSSAHILSSASNPNALQ